MRKAPPAGRHPRAELFRDMKKEVGMIVLLIVGCVVTLSFGIVLFLGRNWLLRQQKENNEVIFQSWHYGSEPPTGGSGSVDESSL
jgi:hypothetical protein